MRSAAEVCPIPSIIEGAYRPPVMTNLIFGKGSRRVDVRSEEAESRRSEKKIVVYSLHLHFFLYIWRTTSPGRGVSNAEIVRRRFSIHLPTSSPHFHPSSPPKHFFFSAWITPYTVPNGRGTDVLKRQSATSPRIVRLRNGSATTAANQATSHRRARSLAPLPPNNATRAEASATSRQSAQPCACKARTKNATYVLDHYPSSP